MELKALPTISPKYPTIDNRLHPLYLVIDHMPGGKFDTVNSIKEIFDAKNLDYSKSFFIFDLYLYLEPFKHNGLFTGYFLPYTTCVDYLKLMPTYELSFDKKTKFAFVMNKSRYQRIITSTWVANNFNPENFNYSKPWESSSISRKYLTNKAGLSLIDKDLEKKWIPYLDTSTDNWIKNTSYGEVFRDVLYPQIYRNSSISIVLEALSSEVGCFITEKFVNAVYGATIPLVDGYHIGECLKAVGFDTFSDLINYDYQYERDPLRRVAIMLNDNLQFIRSSDNIMEKKGIRDRVLYNFNLLRNPKKIMKNIIYNLNYEENIERFKSLSISYKHPIIQTINEVLN